jgi:phospholipase C
LFDRHEYHLRVYGPNGFFREFQGNNQDPGHSRLKYERDGDSVPTLTGKVEINFTPVGETSERTLIVRDNAYGNEEVRAVVAEGKPCRVVIDTSRSHGWYDLRVSCGQLVRRYAGRVETGKPTTSDPAMG